MRRKLVVIFSSPQQPNDKFGEGYDEAIKSDIRKAIRNRGGRVLSIELVDA